MKIRSGFRQASLLAAFSQLPSPCTQGQPPTGVKAQGGQSPDAPQAAGERHPGTPRSPRSGCPPRRPPAQRADDAQHHDGRNRGEPRDWSRCQARGDRGTPTCQEHGSLRAEGPRGGMWQRHLFRGEIQGGSAGNAHSKALPCPSRCQRGSEGRAGSRHPSWAQEPAERG